MSFNNRDLLTRVEITNQPTWFVLSPLLEITTIHIMIHGQLLIFDQCHLIQCHTNCPPRSSYMSDSTSLPRVGTRVAYFANCERPIYEEWYLDSRTTNHLTNNMANMHIINEFKGNDKLIFSNGEGLSITHIGDASFNFNRFKPQYACTHISLKDILFVPSIIKNILNI